MTFFCCRSSNVLQSVIDVSNVHVVDLSANIIDSSNIQLDISNSQQIMSVPVLTIDPEVISNIINDSNHLLEDKKEIHNDISNNPHHIFNVKKEFLTIDLTEPLLEANEEIN
jgi:hypothetical protein